MFLIELPARDAVWLDVYDLQGRRVQPLVVRQLPAGATLAPWNGRDAGGRVVRRGLKLARLSAGPASRSIKVLLGR